MRAHSSSSSSSSAATQHDRERLPLRARAPGGAFESAHSNRKGWYQTNRRGGRGETRGETRAAKEEAQKFARRRTPPLPNSLLRFALCPGDDCGAFLAGRSAPIGALRPIGDHCSDLTFLEIATGVGGGGGGVGGGRASGEAAG